MDTVKEMLAGGAGGACLVLVGHPLDTIKVRIQTMEVKPGEAPPYKGALDCAVKSIRNHGTLKAISSFRAFFSFFLSHQP